VNFDKRLKDLLSRGYELAQSMLESEGQIYAFGVGVRPNGNYRTIMAGDGDRHAILDALRDGLQSSQFKLTAFFEMASVEDQDVTAVYLDRDGWSKLIVIPYELVDGRVVYGASTVLDNPRPLVVETRD